MTLPDQGFVISGSTALSAMRTRGRFSVRLATAADWDRRATGSVREQERSVLTLTLSRTAGTPDTREFSLTLHCRDPADNVYF